MSSRLKGEVKVAVGDRDLIVVYSTDALIELEERFGKSVQEIGQMLGDDLRMTDLRTVFRAGLIEYQPDITEKEAGRIMSELGIPESGSLVVEAFGLAFNAGAGASKAARPSRRPAAGRGIGTPASTSGLSLDSEAPPTLDA